MVARDLDAARRLIDGGVFHQAVEPFVGRGLEAEEDVEVLRNRPPRFEQLRMPGDEIGTALDENPLLAHAAPPQLVGQRKTA